MRRMNAAREGGEERKEKGVEIGARGRRRKDKGEDGEKGEMKDGWGRNKERGEKMKGRIMEIEGGE